MKLLKIFLELELKVLKYLANSNMIYQERPEWMKDTHTRKRCFDKISKNHYDFQQRLKTNPKIPKK